MQGDKFYKFVCPLCGYSGFTDGEPECVNCDESGLDAPANFNGNMGFIRNEKRRESRKELQCSNR